MSLPSNEVMMLPETAESIFCPADTSTPGESFEVDMADAVFWRWDIWIVWVEMSLELSASLFGDSSCVSDIEYSDIQQSPVFNKLLQTSKQSSARVAVFTLAVMHLFRGT